MGKTSILKSCDQLTIWLADGQVVKGYFTCCRVRPEEVPAGMFRYSIREDDNGDGNLCEIHPVIWVNHAGDFLTATPLDCGDGIDIVEWNFEPWE